MAPIPGKPIPWHRQKRDQRATAPAGPRAAKRPSEARSRYGCRRVARPRSLLPVLCAGGTARYSSAITRRCGRQPTRKGAAKRGTVGSHGPVPRPKGGRPALRGAERPAASPEAWAASSPMPCGDRSAPQRTYGVWGAKPPFPSPQGREPTTEGERSEPGAKRSPRGRGFSRLREGTPKRLTVARSRQRRRRGGRHPASRQRCAGRPTGRSGALSSARLPRNRMDEHPSKSQCDCARHVTNAWRCARVSFVTRVQRVLLRGT